MRPRIAWYTDWVLPPSETFARAARMRSSARARWRCRSSSSAIGVCWVLVAKQVSGIRSCSAGVTCLSRCCCDVTGREGRQAPRAGGEELLQHVEFSSAAWVKWSSWRRAVVVQRAARRISRRRTGDPAVGRADRGEHLQPGGEVVGQQRAPHPQAVDSVAGWTAGD